MLSIRIASVPGGREGIKESFRKAIKVSLLNASDCLATARMPWDGWMAMITEHFSLLGT